MLDERSEGARKFNSYGRWIFLGVGVALTALSGYKVFAAVRARKRAAAAAPPPYPGAAGPYPGPPPQPPGTPYPPQAVWHAVSTAEPDPFEWAVDTLAVKVGINPEVLPTWYSRDFEEWRCFASPTGYTNTAYLVHSGTVYAFAPSMQSPEDAVRSARAARAQER